MRSIKEVLRLAAAGMKTRAIAVSLAIAHSTVQDYRRRAAAAAIVWPQADSFTESELHARLFPAIPKPGTPRPLPDWGEIYEELRRKRRTGVTLQLLWQEYKENNPEGLQYSQFTELYRRWRANLDRVLRQEHKAGDKSFVDWAGQTVSIVDRETGEVEREAQIFVAVLGASNYTFAEARASQDLTEWIGAHVNMAEYFGGMSAAVVPDNTKTGVRHPCYYEPDLNPTYHAWALHYDTVILPARVRKPRDKAKAEAGVLLVERWILACLRKRTFFSLEELNEAIAALLERLNHRPFQKLEGTRRSLFDAVDRPALKPLPATPFEFCVWKKVRVNIDYHVEIDKHYYSVPFSLTGHKVEARITSGAIEIMHDGRRVVAHARSYHRGGFTTDPAHQPKAHQRHGWPPSRILSWARNTGPNTEKLAEQIMAARRHPEQGYRACVGIIRLGDRYGKDRTERAAARALRIGALSYRSVESILKQGLDQLEQEPPAPLKLPQEHEHIRGASYYGGTATEPSPIEIDHATQPNH